MSASDIKKRFQSRAGKARRIKKVEDAPADLGDVYVRSLSAAEYDRYEDACVVEEEGKRVGRGNRALLLRMTVCDASGQLVFSPSDDDYLSTLTPDVTVPIAAAALEVSGLTRAAQEEVAKNSEPPTGTASGGS